MVIEYNNIPCIVLNICPYDENLKRVFYNGELTFLYCHDMIYYQISRLYQSPAFLSLINPDHNMILASYDGNTMVADWMSELKNERQKV